VPYLTSLPYPLPCSRNEIEFNELVPSDGIILSDDELEEATVDLPCAVEMCCDRNSSHEDDVGNDEANDIDRTRDMDVVTLNMVVHPYDGNKENIPPEKTNSLQEYGKGTQVRPEDMGFICDHWMSRVALLLLFDWRFELISFCNCIYYCYYLRDRNQ